MNPPSFSSARAEWIARLFPEGVPTLWCPPLTHYDRAGNLDRDRIAAHWTFLAPFVKGLLVPGSTGDGWELTSAESDELTGFALSLCSQYQLRLLIGALRPVAADACQVISHAIETLRSSKATGAAPGAELANRRVCGFAVCPPRGAALSQQEIGNALRQVLQMGVPVALYQLPQVTLNEMSPDLLASLAAEYPNFLLFKDTSGRDLVAESGHDFRGVFLVRGMEGSYDRWLKSAGGPYDGFLLSAANGFAPQLHEMIQQLQTGRRSEAKALSERISKVVDGVFGLVGSMPDGNAFANGGKAVDHFMAHGPGAESVPPPRLHSGRTLPVEVIRGTGALLRQYGLMPAHGYIA